MLIECMVPVVKVNRRRRKAYKLAQVCGSKTGAGHVFQLVVIFVVLITWVAVLLFN